MMTLGDNVSSGGGQQSGMDWLNKRLSYTADTHVIETDSR